MKTIRTSIATIVISSLLTITYTSNLLVSIMLNAVNKLMLDIFGPPSNKKKLPQQTAQKNSQEGFSLIFRHDVIRFNAPLFMLKLRQALCKGIRQNIYIQQPIDCSVRPPKIWEVFFYPRGGNEILTRIWSKNFLRKFLANETKFRFVKRGTSSSAQNLLLT